MIHKIALIATTTVFAATLAFAQNSPPPGNVDPGSMESGAEQTGAPNQPRSEDRQMGTTGAGSGAVPDAGMSREQDGINANVKPSSKESGAEEAGEPANQRR